MLYAATIFNHDFIKKQIQEFDIESFLAMATMIDSEDYFLIFDLYKIFVFCTQQVLFEYSQSINQDSQQKEAQRHAKFLDKVQKHLFDQVVERIWIQLRSEPELLEQDRMLRAYFMQNKNAKQNLIENDMDLLDLSDSEGSVMDLEEAKEEQDIYSSAIQIMLSITETSCLEHMAAAIERSILTAIRAYNQSNMLAQSKKISAEALNRILEHVIGACYVAHPGFCLHMTMVFLLVLLSKSQDGIHAGLCSSSGI